VQPSPPADPWFADVTEESGLNFIHDAGPISDYFMPQIMGSGVALLDYDNDGRLDIYLIQNGGPNGFRNRLFHQEPDGRFRDVSAGSGLDVAGFGMGVAIGDVNNDGWVDVLLTEYGRTRLFLNNGNGTFTDITREAGLDNAQWGTSACFFDYDRDGWLDLVVTNYVDYDPSRSCPSLTGKPDYCSPQTFSGSVTRLFHNLGTKSKDARGAIRFEDVTIKSGLGRVTGSGLGVVCTDFDGDGWPDIFVANDGQANCLWINQHNGTFVDEAVLRGLAFNRNGRVQANMGIALGDIDASGQFSLFVTHLSEELHVLWKQEPRGMFQDETGKVGLASTPFHFTGFGTVLADFDHDGALDLALVNGRVSRSRVSAAADSSDLAPFWQPYAEPNQLFANEGGKFREISAANEAFCGHRRIARGLACGDLDGDGALDLVVTNVAGPARIYRNVVPKRGHWLMVRAIDPRLHRDAYGAEVIVHANGRNWKRWLNPGYSYLTSNDPRGHFGLGQNESFDSVEVLWPDGYRERFPGGTLDRSIVLNRGQGTRAD
jgi:hypothetical protein